MMHPPLNDPAVLLDRLHYRFIDAGLLTEALTHSSVMGGGGTRKGTVSGQYNYERLEFLGDRVLGLVVAEMLYQKFPGDNEGALARRHTALVRRETLAQVAVGIDLGDHIRLSRGEEEAGGRHNSSLLADCCEAVIGALYLDGGLAAAALFIRHYWHPLLSGGENPPKDAKSTLQEWVQARGLPLPVYTTVATNGAPHEPVFSIEVQVEGYASVVAEGSSKRMAEQAAAEILLRNVQGK